METKMFLESMSLRFMQFCGSSWDFSFCGMVHKNYLDFRHQAIP